MENYCRVQQLPAERPAEGTGVDTDTDKRGVEHSLDKLSEEFLIPQSSKGKLASGAREEAEPVDSSSTFASIFHNSLLRQSSASWQVSRGLEWIEMGVRRQDIGAYAEEVVQTERTPVAWNSRLQSAPTMQHFGHAGGSEQPEKINRPGAPDLFLDGYPAVDYPMNEDSDSQAVTQMSASRGFSEELGGTETQRHSDSPSMTTQVIQTSDTEASLDAWSFSKNLKSPGLRRRRTTSVHQGAPTRLSFRDSELPRSASLPNSGSDYNLNTDSSSLSSQQSSDSQPLLRLATFKPNQRMSYEPQEEQSFSESELPDRNTSDRWVGLRPQRRNSNPNFVARERPGARNSETQLTGLPSRLDGVLSRAKVRVREHDGLTTDRQLKITHRRTRFSPPSPSSASEVDTETEWVEEVALMRRRALTVSKGWKEQLVDGDDDDKKDRSESLPQIMRSAQQSFKVD